MLTMNMVMTKMAQSFGMHVIESSVENMNILAKKGDITVYMGYIDENSSNDISNHKVKAEVAGADKVIIWHLTPVTRDVERVAKEAGIELWDRDRVVKEIGRAVLNMVGNEDHPGTDTVSASEGFADIFMERIKRDMKSIVEPSASPVENGVFYLKAELTLDDIKKRVDPKFHSYEFKLQYVPYYIYRYSLQLTERKSGNTREVSGMVAVHGLDGSIVPWEGSFPGRDTVPKPDDDTIIHDTKYDEDEARKMAEKAVLNVSNYTEEEQMVKDNTIIYHMLHWIPDDTTLNMEYLGLLYVPLWGIAGRDGVMLVDATTGRILKEDLYRGV